MSVEATYFISCFPIWSPSKVFHNWTFTCSMCFSVHNTFIDCDWIFWTHSCCTVSRTSSCCALIWKLPKNQTQPEPLAPQMVNKSYLLTNPKVAKHLCKSPIWENDWYDFWNSPCWITVTSYLREMTHLFQRVSKPPKSKLFRIFWFANKSNESSFRSEKSEWRQRG